MSYNIGSGAYIVWSSRKDFGVACDYPWLVIVSAERGKSNIPCQSARVTLRRHA